MFSKNQLNYFFAIKDKQVHFKDMLSSLNILYIGSEVAFFVHQWKKGNPQQQEFTNVHISIVAHFRYIKLHVSTSTFKSDKYFKHIWLVRYSDHFFC